MQAGDGGGWFGPGYQQQWQWKYIRLLAVVWIVRGTEFSDILDIDWESRDKALGFWPEFPPWMVKLLITKVGQTGNSLEKKALQSTFRHHTCEIPIRQAGRDINKVVVVGYY